jgi:hypothetical protein
MTTDLSLSTAWPTGLRRFSAVEPHRSTCGTARSWRSWVERLRQKTTTLRMIAGFEPDRRRNWFGGAPSCRSGGIDLPPEQRTIGMVFQSTRCGRI